MQKYADAIHNVINVDIDIADESLIRVAGNGIFDIDIGTDVLKEARVIKHVLNNGKPLVIKSPREQDICLSCNQKNVCKEKIEICVPIATGDSILGAIAIGTSSDKVSDKINKDLDNYIEFLKTISELIASSLIEKCMLASERSTKKTLEKVINRVDTGILILDHLGNINYINYKAEQILGASRKQLEYLIKIKQFEVNYSIKKDSLSSIDFNIKIRNLNIRLNGKISDIQFGNKQIGTLFTFEKTIDIQRKVLEAANNIYTISFESIIGKDDALLKAVEEAKMMAYVDKNLLIHGESGTGKEIFIRAIHNEGAWKSKPLMTVVCEGSPEMILEKEIFGSDEDDSSGGKLALAYGGVIFFDEIADLPMKLQRRLVKVLKDNKIRIMATTKRNIQELIAQNLFLHNLYYKIREFAIEIPSVRNRNDTKYLLNFFKVKYEINEETKINYSDSVYTLLKAYKWPGNIREIDSVFGLLSVLSKSHDLIEVDMLPNYLKKTNNSNNTRIFNLEKIEKDTIIEALNLFPNTSEGKTQAAEALGIGMATLYRKIKKYNIKSKKNYS